MAQTGFCGRPSSVCQFRTRKRSIGSALLCNTAQPARAEHTNTIGERCGRTRSRFMVRDFAQDSRFRCLGKTNSTAPMPRLHLASTARPERGLSPDESGQLTSSSKLTEPQRPPHGSSDVAADWKVRAPAAEPDQPNGTLGVERAG